MSDEEQEPISFSEFIQHLKDTNRWDILEIMGIRKPIEQIEKEIKEFKDAMGIESLVNYELGESSKWKK